MATLEEYKRFVASAPESAREIRTIEVAHVDLDRVYRFVQDYSDFTAQIETGESVTFKAAGLRIIEPSERNDSEQALQVSMGAVSDELQSILDQISGLGYMSEIKVTYRKYYSLNLTKPAVPPLVLYGSDISFNNSEEVSFVAEDTDLSNKRSGQLYTLAEFKGLETA